MTVGQQKEKEPDVVEEEEEEAEAVEEGTAAEARGAKLSLQNAMKILDSSSTVFNPETKPIPMAYSAVPLSLEVDQTLSEAHPCLGKFTALIGSCVPHERQREMDAKHLDELKKSLERVNLLTFHPIFVSVSICTF